MSARENLLRKSCRAPADNHFIYVSHRQHSCGKKDLYQRFFTTDENVTLSANTRLPSFLADRQSAVLKRAKEVLSGWSATLRATWKAAENDCLERRNSIRLCVPSHVAYKAERGGNELFWSPWKMYPRSQERRRNREATVYLPALGGDGPRLDRTIRIYKCSQASSAEESLKCCAALLAVSTEA